MIIDIYNILFKENLSPSIVFFLISLISAESYLLIRLKRNNKFTNAVIVGITAVSVLFSMALVAKPNEITDRYEKWYAPEYNGSGCMAEAFKNEDPSGEYYQNTVIFNHYFEGKELIICDDIELKDDIAFYLGVFSSADNISFSSDYKSEITKERINEIESGVVYLKKDSRKYLLDKTWKKSKTIIGTSVEDTVYFMSKELFEDISNDDYEKDLLSKVIGTCPP